MLAKIGPGTIDSKSSSSEQQWQCAMCGRLTDEVVLKCTKIVLLSASNLIACRALVLKMKAEM